MDAHILSNWFRDQLVVIGSLGRMRKRMVFIDDFDDDAIAQWDSSVGTFAKAAESGRSTITGTTGATIGNQAQLVEDPPGTSKPYKASNRPELEASLALDDPDNADIFFLLGLTSATPAGGEAVPPQFIGFGIDDALDADNFVAITNAGAGPTVVDTGVPLDTGFHRFNIKVEIGRVRFLIDGILVATITTTVPSADLMRVVSLETRESAGNAFEIDYYALIANRG